MGVVRRVASVGVVREWCVGCGQGSGFCGCGVEEVVGGMWPVGVGMVCGGQAWSVWRHTVDVRSIGLLLLLSHAVSSQVRTWSCRTSKWSEQPFSLG